VKPVLARLLLFATAATLACDDTSYRPVASGPNVILIVVDTLRADRLTQYGHTRDTSSALSQLTDASVRFEDCASPAPWTAPSVASLFTGLHPARHQVDRVGSALSPGVETLAETLQIAGWNTAAFTFNPHITRRAHFDQGFDEFVSYRGVARRAPDVRDMMREAWRWITDEARSPFFLYLQPMNVHGPYRVPEDARALLLGRPPVEGFEFFGPLMKGLLHEGRTLLREDVSAEIRQSLEEQYDTAIRHTAEELAAFFRSLESSNLWDSSLIVLTADHGEELFDHGGFSHRYSLHREVVHVPLFVKLPGPGRTGVIDEPVSLTDLHPTLLDLLGLGAGDTDGRSLAPFLTGDPVPEPLRHRALLSSVENPGRCEASALRLGRHRLLVIERNYEGLENESFLYDLEADPGETRDLSDEQPEIVAQLMRELHAIEDAHPGRREPRETYRLNPEERAALEALGYL
jgi:arylsulfatase A-like enzyme